MDLNDNTHAKFIHVCNSITLGSDLVHIVLAMFPGNPDSVRMGTDPKAPVWIWTRQVDPPRFVLASSSSGPDINPRFLAGVNPDRSFILAVPATFTPTKYVSSDCIMV